MAAPHRQPGRAGRSRQLTICNKYFPRVRSGSGFARFPIISLSGKWLQEAGFRAGQVIDIACEEEGRLTITLAKRQRFAV